MPRRNSLDIPVLSRLLGSHRVGEDFDEAETTDEEAAVALDATLGPDPAELLGYKPSNVETVHGTDYTEVEFVEAINRLRGATEEIAQHVDETEREAERIFERAVGESGTDRMTGKLAMEIYETYAEQGKVTLRQLSETLVGLNEMWAQHVAEERQLEAMGAIDIVDIDVQGWERRQDEISDRQERRQERLQRIRDRAGPGGDADEFLPEQEERLSSVERADRAEAAGVSPDTLDTGRDDDDDPMQPSAVTGGDGGDSPSGGPAGTADDDEIADGDIPSPDEIMNRVRRNADD